MMGSGKTVTARELARRLNYRFVDLDHLIEEQNETTISEIFEKRGEGNFRKLESIVIAQVTQQEKQVVATGGGSVLLEENVKNMRSAGTVIYLETSIDQLWDRVQNSDNRPLVKNVKDKQGFADLFRSRDSLYKSTSDVAVNTDGQTPGEVAARIQEALKK